MGVSGIGEGGGVGRAWYRLVDFIFRFFFASLRCVLFLLPRYELPLAWQLILRACVLYVVGRGDPRAIHVSFPGGGGRGSLMCGGVFMLPAPPLPQSVFVSVPPGRRFCWWEWDKLVFHFVWGLTCGFRGEGVSRFTLAARVGGGRGREGGQSGEVLDAYTDSHMALFLSRVPLWVV